MTTTERNGNGAGVVAALEHLSVRIPALCSTQSNNRHWTREDLAAVALLIDRPASREQIALARVEGICFDETMLHGTEIRRIESIARRALGLA